MATFSQLLEQHAEYTKQMNALMLDKGILQSLIASCKLTEETRDLIGEALAKVESSIEYLAGEIKDLMETEVQE